MNGWKNARPLDDTKRNPQTRGGTKPEDGRPQKGPGALFAPRFATQAPEVKATYLRRVLILQYKQHGNDRHKHTYTRTRRLLARATKLVKTDSIARDRKSTFGVKQVSSLFWSENKRETVE